MQPIRHPRYALLLMYDIRSGVNVPYFRFVRQELEPAMRDAGLYLQDAWHIAYGPYPERQLEFITDELSHISSVMHSPRWERLEDKLLNYVENYTVRVTPYTGLFKV